MMDTTNMECNDRNVSAINSKSEFIIENKPENTEVQLRNNITNNLEYNGPDNNSHNDINLPPKNKEIEENEVPVTSQTITVQTADVSADDNSNTSTSSRLDHGDNGNISQSNGASEQQTSRSETSNNDTTQRYISNKSTDGNGTQQVSGAEQDSGALYCQNPSSFNSRPSTNDIVPSSEHRGSRKRDAAPTVVNNQVDDDDDGWNLAACSRFLIRHLENFYVCHGRRVARHPFITIAICVVTSLIASIGIINFTTEIKPFKLWIPQSSEFIRMLEWQNDHFPKHFRRHVVLWEAPNVLTAAVIQEMWRTHQVVRDTVDPDTGKTWLNVCGLLPSLNTNSEEELEEPEGELGILEYRRKREAEENEFLDDISFLLSRINYCGMLSNLPSYCYETGLLEIWGWRNNVIMNLTDDQVVKDFNEATVSDVFGFKTDFESYIGGVSRNDEGKIISAKATRHIWYTDANQTSFEEGNYEIDVGNGELVDVASMSWENLWLETIQNTTLRPKSITAYTNAARSFGEVSDDNIWGDINYLIIGFVLMAIFVNVTLGRLNKVEQRPLLSWCGIICVALSIFASYGICSVFNIRFCPINSILPLILIGLGVDDMFIIVSVWDDDTVKQNLQNGSESDSDLVEKAARTMRHAGVAITATSLTDVAAFAIGASTDLPGLRSFCIYGSVGILIIFLLQSTLFLSFLVLDERRLRQNRNGFLWFIVHKDWKPSACSRVDILKKYFKLYSNIILKDVPRCIVLILTAIAMIISVIGTTWLKQEFNPQWFIPTDSYLADYFRASKAHFENEGAPAFLFFTNRSMARNLPKFIALNNELDSAESVVETYAWFDTFKSYTELNVDFSNRTFTESLFSDAISLFFFTETGGAYRPNVVFDGDISCNVIAPPIEYFRIPFKHRVAEIPKLQQKFLTEIRGLLESANLPGYEGIWSPDYGVWETNVIVGEELLRNMTLTAVVITGMTLILLVSFRSALLVLSCVAGSVVSVTATMYIFQFTIDTVSCICLVLSIGLSVDYSVHIAHSFVSDESNGDKRERAARALVNVGPAVLKGGLSTLFPFLMLGFSNSHVFVTFFAVFTPTTIAGLYYALVFLPVLLSFVGPEPRKSLTPAPLTPSNQYINNSFSINSEYDLEPRESGRVLCY